LFNYFKKMTSSYTGSKTIVGLILARGGSKSIPRKNIKPLGGFPLIAWTITAALRSKVFGEHVWVSTDDDEIASIAAVFGAKVHRRNASTATDTASSESAMIEFAQVHSEYDVVSLIQATSPFTKPNHFVESWYRFVSNWEKFDSLLTITESIRFRWGWNATTEQSLALNYDPMRRPRRQDYSPEFIETGSFYYTKRDTLLSLGCRIEPSRCTAYIMPHYTTTEIDDPLDWLVCETIARDAQHIWVMEGLYTPKYIKLFVSDVDGVLTDGTVLVSTEGELAKRFNVRDGHGISLLKEHGVEVRFLTTEETNFPQVRASKLGVKIGIAKGRKKLEILQEWMKELTIEFEEVVYIGDDLPDIECLKHVGFSCCPADAEQEVQRVCKFICKKQGGNGCLREVVNYLIQNNFVKPTTQ
jgi:N-acylneuraminate cytidylyltransferase